MVTLAIAPKINTGIIPQNIKIIDYKEGLGRLHELIDLIRGKIAIGDSTLIGKNFGFLKILGIALEAQHKLIGYLNDELISCPIAWDETTGFPSHPTLAADLQKYLEIFKPQDDVLKTILRSFAHWELLVQETSVRCCGSITKLKTVKMDIKINHVLKTEDGWLSFKQLVGVESADLSHQELRDYFDFRRPSKNIDGLMIIFSREWLLRAKDGELETKEVKTEKAELFNLEKFQNMIDSLQIS
ncbi:MAG: hypothetical protein HYT65_00210 [Candidatus Yanofskybacteria bacterium]|nr:hypothetical protein [Candidatus Yanofskybacteria bacterium]